MTLPGQPWTPKNQAERIVFGDDVWFARSLTGSAVSSSRVERWGKRFDKKKSEYLVEWPQFIGMYTVLHGRFYWAKHNGATISISDTDGIRFTIPAFNASSVVRLSSCALGLVLMEYLYQNHCTIRRFSITGVLTGTVTLPAPLSVMEPTSIDADSRHFILSGFSMSGATYRTECYNWAGQLLWHYHAGINTTLTSCGITEPFAFVQDHPVTRVVNPATGAHLLDIPSGAASFGDFAPGSQYAFAYNGTDTLYVAWDGYTYQGPTFSQGFIEMYNVVVNHDNLSLSTFTPVGVFAFPATNQFARGVFRDRGKL